MQTKTTPKFTVAEFIADKIAQSDKTQKQIADECGFENPNVITMFKKGATKLPVNRIGALARAIDVDSAHLFRLVMRDYAPDTWETIEEMLNGTVLTANELDLIRAYREATGDSDARAVVIKGETVIEIVAS